MSTTNRPFPVLSAFPLLLTAAWSSHLAGCSATRDTAARLHAPSSAPGAIDSLRLLAQSESAKFEPPSTPLHPPPGLDPALIAQADANSQTARVAWSQDFHLRFPLPTVSTPPSAPIDDGARAEALSHYAAGREKLLSGNAASALQEFQRATRLDPDAPEPWRELAEASLLAGRRSGALIAFEESINRGIQDARPYAWVGRESLRTKGPGPAIPFLLEARRLNPAASDPALGFLVDADLAECLESLGYLRAARDLYRLALSLPDQFVSGTNLRAELSELYRRRGELWLHAGDLACRIGDFEAAESAYANSLRFPNPDPGAVAVRRVHALLRQGRPAGAALVLVEDVLASQGRIDDRQVALISYLAANTPIGPVLADSIREVAGALPRPLAPTIRARLARADAAARPAKQAREVLRSELLQSPGDADAILALLDLCPTDQPSETAVELGRLARQHPSHAGFLADALLLRGVGVESLIEYLGRRNARPFEYRLLRSELLRRTARPVEAMMEIASVPEKEWSQESFPFAMATLAECAAASGDWDKANSAASAISDSPVRVARARAFVALQRLSEAADCLSTIPDSPGASVDDLTYTAEVCFRAARHGVAERAAMLAVQLDRFDDRPAAVLFNLYGPGGPLRDDAKFADAVRSLRQASPSSRLVRAIVARDLISRNLHSQAEPYLLALAEGSPVNGELSDLLCRVYEHASVTDMPTALRGESWIASRLAAAPDSIPLIVAHARILAATNRANQADELLERRLAVWPVPILARLRERIVRDKLGDSERADSLLRERLSSSPPTIENSIEHAEFLARKGDAPGAASVLVRGLPPGISISKEQEAFLLSVLARVGNNTDAMSRGEAAGAVALFDRAIDLRLSLSRDLAWKRLRLLGLAYPDQTQRLCDAVLVTISVFPDSGLAAYDQLHQSLIKANNPDAEVRFLRAALEQSRPWNAEIARVAVVRIASVGTPEDVVSFFESIRGTDHLRALLRSLQADTEPGTEDAMRAELAYTFGVILYNFDRVDQALAMYRVAIALRPDHALANNNLGYHYAERGENLDEAEKLLEAAYLADPVNYSITDSLGWIRYKRNILVDEVDANGIVVREGAATLVRRALENARGTDSEPALLDHMGDILWRLGQREQARTMWQSAEGILMGRVVASRRSQGERSPANIRDGKEYDRIHAKSVAVRNGRAPAVSPIPGVDDPK